MTAPLASREDITEALVTWFMGQATLDRDPETGQADTDDEALERECQTRAQAVWDLVEGTDTVGLQLLMEAHQRAAVENAYRRTGRPLPPDAPF
jgi:hypothetical protein